MMRVRRASGIVLLSLLASAATASADCAWIWWETTGDVVAAIGGYTKQECQQAISAYETSAKEWVKVGKLWDGRVTVTATVGGQKVLTIHSCIPDTVDPRGPKGTDGDEKSA